MEALLAAFRSLGPARILALFIGLSATVFITGLVVSRLNTPGYALLYGGLDVQETSSITQYLGSQNIPYETRGDGAVYVPADQVGQLRLSVAGQGLVGSSNSGYELFDNASTFGTTNFVQNLNARRALEGELARTIATIPAVSGARVHIVMPKQNIFSSQQITPSAAVALNVGARTLDTAQVGSIAQLVAAAVPNLSSDHITIIDQRGTLLFDGKTSATTTAAATTARDKVEQQYETELTAMLERVVGAGKAAVQVTAQVNMEEIEESSEIFDPTQQVVRSEQLVEVANTSADGGGASPVGVQGNIPGDGAGAGAGGSSNSAENRTETTTNYEIGRTVRQRKVAGGQVEKLSVAVLIEGKTAENENGEKVYTPYNEGDLTRFRRLVESAIGYNAARGDQVEIADMQFSVPDEISTADAPFLTKDQIIQFVEYGLLLVALLLVAFMVVRPTLTLLTSALGTSLPSAALPPLQASGPLGGDGSSGGSITGAPPMGESTIDISQVRGRVKESSVKKVTEIIDQHPEESLNVVRNWMAQDSNRTREEF